MKLLEAFRITSEAELSKPVTSLLDRLKSGDWVALNGDLGAGKTTFVRHIIRMLGSDEIVSSPTYPLLLEYVVGTQKIIHIDGFRLDGATPDPWDFREWKDAIVFVEWSEKTQLPRANFKFIVQILPLDEGKREITFFSPSF